MISGWRRSNCCVSDLFQIRTDPCDNRIIVSITEKNKEKKSKKKKKEEEERKKRKEKKRRQKRRRRRGGRLGESKRLIKQPRKQEVEIT